MKMMFRHINSDIIQRMELFGRIKPPIIEAEIKTDNKNGPLNLHGWEGFVRLCLSFHVDLMGTSIRSDQAI